MAKRSNPYVEDFIPQSKVYLNQKLYNNNEDRLQKVYDKTLQLLFNGAKKAEQVVCENTCPSKIGNDGLKQLFISKTGSLLHSGTMITKENVAVKKCVCGSNNTDKCSYCEVGLCSACTHFCTLCVNYYCGNCSLAGLDDTEICVSCYI